VLPSRLLACPISRLKIVEESGFRRAGVGTSLYPHMTFSGKLIRIDATLFVHMVLTCRKASPELVEGKHLRKWRALGVTPKPSVS
jgi:hypothetical protein